MKLRFVECARRVLTARHSTLTDVLKATNSHRERPLVLRDANGFGDRVAPPVRYSSDLRQVLN